MVRDFLFQDIGIRISFKRNALDIQSLLEKNVSFVQLTVHLAFPHL